MKENNLPRSLVLKKRIDITTLINKGKCFDGSCIRIIVMVKPDQIYGKTAFLVNKRLGRKANRRVKVKRWLRELFRNNKKKMPLYADLALSVRIPYKNLTFRNLFDDFNSVISSEKFIDFCCQNLPKTIVALENQ